MKKLLVALLAVVAVGCGAIGLTSCGEGSAISDMSSDISMHTHDWNERVTKEATCEKEGELMYSCYCGESYTMPLEALGHNLKSINAKEPNCTEFGWETYELCERDGCEYTTYVQIEARGHNFDKGVCIVEGCGVQQPPEDHITHEWDNGVVTTEPTCTEKGIKTYTCWCTEKYTKPVVELGHDLEQHEGQAATCVAVGWNAYETCSRCDYSTYGEIAIDENNHNYEDGICIDCENKIHSKGLSYTLSRNNYIVAGIGECTDTDIIIPATYKGLPVTSIGDEAFYWVTGCSSLTSVVIPNSVTSIGDEAFRYCRTLSSIVIPDSVTSIGERAFESCIITDVYYSGDIAGWCAIGYVDSGSNPFSEYGTNFYIDNQLVTKLIIPNSVTSIKDYAFAGCSLTEVVIPESVTSIGQYAFSNCSGLTEVVIPESVMSIGQYAFKWCTSLMSVVIPDGVTSIGDCTFTTCKSLTEVVIGNSVTSIGAVTFAGCSSLTSVNETNR